MARSLPLRRCDNLEELEDDINAVLQGIDWGWVRIAETGRFIEITHGAYPVIPQDENRRSWLVPLLEGVYTEWFGAQGGDPGFPPGWSANGVASARRSPSITAGTADRGQPGGNPPGGTIAANVASRSPPLPTEPMRTIARACCSCRPSLLLLGGAAGLAQADRSRRNGRKYRDRFVTEDGRVLDTGNKEVSHTEGQGWAMLFAEAADDRASFAKIWQWTRDNLQRATTRCSRGGSIRPTARRRWPTSTTRRTATS